MKHTNVRQAKTLNVYATIALVLCNTECIFYSVFSTTNYFLQYAAQNTQMNTSTVKLLSNVNIMKIRETTVQNKTVTNIITDHNCTGTFLLNYRENAF